MQRETHRGATTLPEPDAEVARQLAELDGRGFTIIPDLLDTAAVATLAQDLDGRMGRHRGRNDFEGFETERLYTLVNHGRLYQDLCEHPRIVALLDQVLSPGYLLSVTQAIAMLPGETPQGLHRDDGYYPDTASGAPHSVSLMIAIDAFTADNGATEMVPGSHRWPRSESARYLMATDADLEPGALDLEKVVMPAGACAVWLGSTMHRGGANRSAKPRRSITNQYCNPWLRPQETLLLSVPAETAAAMSPRLQAMLGYAILPPFMGHLTGLHPARALPRAPARAPAAS